MEEKPKKPAMTKPIHPTRFMIDLKKKIMDVRNVAETTANAYINCLVRINNNNMFSTLGFLKTKKDAVLSYLDEKDISNRLTHLSAIVAAVSIYKDSPTYLKVFREYQSMLMELRGEKDSSTVPNVKTEKQERNWEDWDEIVKEYNDLREEVKTFENERKITRAQWSILTDCMILGLYVLIPPRRNADYQKMFIRYNGPLITDKSVNVYEHGEKTFHFNVFKTAKYMGSQSIVIPDELAELIDIYMKFHPLIVGAKRPNMVRFIVNEDGGVPRDNYITLRLRKIFKKNIGSSMLRHIYISHQFGEEFKELKEKEKERQKVADAMGHNLDMQKKYFLESKDEK